MGDRFGNMSIDELKEKLKKLKDNLSDLEDLHAFTFWKTSLHIGAEKAQNMQTEFEEECAIYAEQIAKVEKALQKKENQQCG
jgi:oligoendopeptidase F